MAKIWTKEEIKELIATNDTMVVRSLIKLYECQTASEQNSRETHEQNGIGFNGADANILSSFVEFYNRTGFLSVKQIAIARKKLPKYAKQLANIANR